MISEPEGSRVERDVEGDLHEGSLEETPTRLMRKPVVADKDSRSPFTIRQNNIEKVIGTSGKNHC